MAAAAVLGLVLFLPAVVYLRLPTARSGRDGTAADGAHQALRALLKSLVALVSVATAESNPDHGFVGVLVAALLFELARRATRPFGELADGCDGNLALMGGALLTGWAALSAWSGWASKSYMCTGMLALAAAATLLALLLARYHPRCWKRRAALRAAGLDEGISSFCLNHSQLYGESL